MFIAFYFILMVLAAAFAILEDDEERKGKADMLVYALFVMVLFLLAAFRPVGIDNDSQNYVDLFYGRANELVEMEFSFEVIAGFCRLIVDDPRLMFVAYALLSIPIRAVGMARASRLWMLSLVVWMGYYYIYQDFTQIRVAVSTGIFIFALDFLAKGRRSVTLALVLLAVFFHRTAALYLPLLLLGSKPLNNIWRITLATVPVVGMFINLMHIDPVMFLPIGAVQDKIELYETMRDSGVMGDEINTFNLVFLARLAVFYFLLWKERFIGESVPAISLFLKIYAYSLLGFFIFSFMPVFAWRVSELTGVIEIIMFPCMAYAFREKIYGKVLVMLYAFMQAVQAMVLTSDSIHPDV